MDIGADGSFGQTGTPEVTGGVSGTSQYTVAGRFSTMPQAAGSGTLVLNVQIVTPNEPCSTGAIAWSVTRSG